jgi:hypothetical protein
MVNGHDRMVVGFTNTCAISAYHHKCYEFESCSMQGVLDATLCIKKFASDLQQVGSFLGVLLFSPSIKLTATI